MSNQTTKPESGTTSECVEHTPRANPLLAEKPDLLIAMVSRVWAKFAGLYGSRWTEAGNDRDTWATELSVFHKLSFEYAVKQSEVHCLEWPPTLAQFKAWCRMVAAPLESRVRYPQLTQEPTAPATARKHLDAIGKKLGFPVRA